MKRGKTFPLFPDEVVRERLRGRIMRNVFIDQVTGCWRWLCFKSRTSRKSRPTQQWYPRITMRLPGYDYPKSLMATRVSLEVFKGPPEHGQEAAHAITCPYTDCVNPAHLRWASREENEADKRHPSRLRFRQVHPPLHRLFPADEEEACPF